MRQTLQALINLHFNVTLVPQTISSLAPRKERLSSCAQTADAW